MIAPSQIPNPYVKPKWQAPVGVMESVVSYNCRKYGMPRPVLAMPMWEGAGNRALDLSGHGNHGTLNEPNWVVDGVDFNGSSDVIQVTGATNIPFPRTVSIITIVDEYVDWVRLFVYTDASGDASSIAQAASNDFVCAGETTLQDSFDLPIDEEIHITAVFNSESDVDVYLNGEIPVVRSASILIQGNVPNSSVSIGARWNTSFINASIKHASLYPCALTTAQVKFLYDNPYFMYRLPEELCGYTAAAAGISIPILMQQMNQFDGGTYALC